LPILGKTVSCGQCRIKFAIALLERSTQAPSASRK